MANAVTDARAAVALLIDGENVSPDMLEACYDKIATLGELQVRRLIGNFRVATTSSWKGCEERYALSAVQSTAYVSGKNTSDSRLVIEAMKVFYETDIRTFVIMSSDSDFTQLAVFLRENGATVIGIGLENASPAWRCAVSDFWVYRKVKAGHERPSPAHTQEKTVVVKASEGTQTKSVPPGKPKLTQVKTLHRWITTLCNENKGPKGWTQITKLEKLLETRFEISYPKNEKADNLLAFLRMHNERYETSRNLLVRLLA